MNMVPSLRVVLVGLIQISWGIPGIPEVRLEWYSPPMEVPSVGNRILSLLQPARDVRQSI